MHTFLDAKIMAKTLRAALAERRIDITHSDALELVAKQFGLKDWNTLSARIDSADVPNGKLPEGWVTHYGNGRAVGDRMHRLGLDPTHPGAIRIESIANAEVVGSHFATIMQSVDAAEYRGTRIRLAAELMGEGVDRGALWVRIDDPAGKVVRFDNMLDRPAPSGLTGTFNWTARDVVLDVPTEAASIHFGAMLRGAGRLWIRRFHLEDAGTATPTRHLPRRPNLDLGGVAA